MTDEGDRRQPVRGGETDRPTAPHLEHAPGERYAVRRANTQASIGRGLIYGAASVLAVSLAWAIAAGLLGISWGLVVVAAFGGWLIGSVVAYGVWRAAAHAPDARVRVMAAGLAAISWLTGSFGAYLAALVILPGSTTSLGERIVNAPFVDALATQFSLIDLLEIVVLVAVAWRSAR